MKPTGEARGSDSIMGVHTTEADTGRPQGLGSVAGDGRHLGSVSNVCPRSGA